MNYPDFFDDILLEKRKQLLQLGYTPYPYDYHITHTVQQIIDQEENLIKTENDVSISGRIWAQRSAGKAWFTDLKDHTGKIQLYLKKDKVTEKVWALLTSLCDIGDIILVTGKIFRTRAGELSVSITDANMLSKSVVRLPVGKETDESAFNQATDFEIQYRERYIYWNINSAAKKLIEQRYKIISLIREWMNNEGFLEVQTPTIEMVYGGAEARPFETRIWSLNNQKAYLRISPELYLKRYIISGFDKVYTICQNFRNEGIDKSHNPEFSMMEWYEVGTDYAVQMVRFENLVEYLAVKMHGSTSIQYQGKFINFKTPWKRLSVVSAIKEFTGIDVVNMNRAELANFLKDKQVEVDTDAIKGVLIARAFEELCEKHLIQPTFIIDHPVEISPLTKTKRGLPGFVERFEPFINTMEVGNAYSELTDPVEQFERLWAQRNIVNKEEDYENHPIDYDFVKAIGVGMPPTGGVGLGIDRIIMLLTNAASIKDITPFPMMKPKMDIV